jgi:hemoglobin
MAALYDEVGGAAGIKTAVAVLYQRLLDDPELAPWFADVDLTRLRAHQRAFLTAALGGPDLFTGREMADAHAGRKVTDRAFDQLLSHLAVTLRDLGVAPSAVARVCRRLEGVREPIVDRGAEGEDVRPAPARHSGARPDR